MRLRKSTKLIFLLCALLAGQGAAAAQNSGIDAALARQYFEEARALCERDAGKLWGTSLCGPILFVDPETRAIAANDADREGKLTKQDSLFKGRWPEQEGMANTATTWAGVKWTMIIWPLPTSATDRARLMMHESFHRIQEQLGLPAANPSNPHLDSREGRIWLQLEWRALRRALLHQGSERREAIADALIFRSYRRQLFPEAAKEERALEMNEGLAEYTGVKLSGTPEAETLHILAARLEGAKNRPSFVRSFAYESGPAYGLLLDAVSADWRKGLRAQDDLALLLRDALSVQLLADLKEEAERHAKAYDGDALRAEETARENAQKKRVAEYRARLVSKPVLVIPLTDKVSYSFDPYNLVALDNLGIVYPTLRVTDAWGILAVSGGALMTREGGRVARVYVPAPADQNARPLQGDGWTLELAPGWTLRPTERKGDYALQKSAP